MTRQYLGDTGDGFPDPRSSGRKALLMMNSPAARLTAREIIAKTFSFDQIVEAHRYLESNQQFGKIVLEL